MRDGLTHFEDWARGKGRGAQAAARAGGAALREIARDHWGFGYDPADDTVTMGPFTIPVNVAVPAANELCSAIYAAADAVDRKAVGELRRLTTQALSDAAIPYGPPDGSVLVSPGTDKQIWVSIQHNSGADNERLQLAAQVNAALANAGVRLMSQTYPQADDITERLAAGEPLIVQRISPASA
jgi:hypothetical protein